MIRLLMAQSTGTISVISNMWAAVPPPAEHGFAYDLWVGILANFLTAALVIGSGLFGSLPPSDDDYSGSLAWLTKKPCGFSFVRYPIKELPKDWSDSRKL